MRSLSWRVKLTALFTLVLLASLLLQLFCVLPFIRNQQVMGETHQREVARNIGWELDRHLTRFANELTIIAKGEEFRNMDVVNQTQTMVEVVEISTSLSSLFVMDAEGWFVSGTVDNFPVYTTKSYADKPYFIVPFEQGEVSFAQTQFYSQPEIVATTVSVPIKSDTGERVGVLVGNMLLNELIEYVANYPLREEQVAFLVDIGGRVVAHSEIDLFALEEGPLSLDYSDLPMVQAVMAGGVAGGTQKYVTTDVSYFAAYAILESNGWGVVVEVPMSVILGKSNVLTGQLIFINIALFTVTLGITLVLTKQITAAQKRAEEALWESEKRYRDLIEKEKDIIYSLDNKGEITFASPAVEIILGYRPEEVIGKNFMALIPKEWQEETGADFNNLLKTGEITAETVLLDKKEQPHFMEYSSTVIKEDNKVVGTRGIVRDITERKRMEEEMRVKDNAIASSINAVAIADLEGNVTYVNQAFLRMWGYDDEKEVLGKSAVAFWQVAEEAVEVMQVAMDRGGWVGELAARRKDGSIFDVQLSASVVRDEAGEPICRFGSFVDITERKRMERELRERNEQLDVQNEELQSQTEELMTQQQELIEKTEEVERANRLKSEFLANMSHGLRTPLNVIIGFSELMKDEVPGKINKEQRQCLSDVLASSQHLLNLINEVLDLSKVESGKTRFHLTNLALTEVTESLARTMLPILAPRQQSLDVEIEEGLPLVHADKAKLSEVLLNLLSNATKFTPDGGKLKVEAVREDNWCRVSVIDNGIGIKKEDQEQIFEPFYQLDNPLTKEKSGTGLGLALVKQIIEKHGGQIWVESEYGGGSRFTFTLPLATTD
ncbi:Sensor histidine kinase RcsC [subsurface metagenome]